MGVNIHKVACASIKNGSLDRLIPANWSNIPVQSSKLRIEILVENRLGVLRKLTDIFYLMRINIDEIAQKTESNGELARLYLLLSMDEDDYYLYDRLIERVKLSVPEYRNSSLVEIT